MVVERFKVRAASYLLIIENNKILLQKRAGTNYLCGWYGVPSGHVEEGEGARLCAIRELEEETGLKVEEKDLEFKCVLNRLSDTEYIDFFFLVKKYKGTPKIMEPNKCSDLQFFDLDNLPQNIVPYIKTVLENIKNNIFYDIIGYNK